MKVRDFIKKLEEVGYGDDTELFLHLCTFDGEVCETPVEEIERERGDDYDMVSVTMTEPSADFLVQLMGGKVDIDDIANEIAGMIAERLGIAY